MQCAARRRPAAATRRDRRASARRLVTALPADASPAPACKLSPPPRAAADSAASWARTARPRLPASSSASSYGVLPSRPNCARRYSSSTPRFRAVPSGSARLAPSTRVVADRPLGLAAARLRAPSRALAPAACAPARRPRVYGRDDLVEVGIVRAPHQVAAADARGVDRADCRTAAPACRRALLPRKCGRPLPAPRDCASRRHRTPRRRPA